MKPTLIFDLAETLIGGLYWMVPPTARLLEVPEESIIPGLGGDPLVALLEGNSTEQDYWEAVLSRTQWPTTPTKLASLARDAFQQVVPGMPELLGELKGYRLVLLSDHAEEWMRDIDPYHGFLQIFDRRFLSFEMKRTKRSPATFLYVASELKTQPEDCVFIDDLQWNTYRASSVGFRAIPFSTATQLQKDLKEQGIISDQATAKGTVEPIVASPGEGIV